MRWLQPSCGEIEINIKNKHCGTSIPGGGQTGGQPDLRGWARWGSWGWGQMERDGGETR